MPYTHSLRLVTTCHKHFHMFLQDLSKNDPIINLTFPFCNLHMVDFINIHTSHNELLTTHTDYKQ